MAGAALDRDYAPTYKGMSDKTRISGWDPPFPMDLRLIRPQDEQYWDRYRAAPKAFVSLPAAKELWTSRFGQLTSLRLTSAEESGREEALARFSTELRQRLDPADFGLALQPVKQAGLEASAGATDFSGLFIGFSMFLIAAAAILVSLLFSARRRAARQGNRDAASDRATRLGSRGSSSWAKVRPWPASAALSESPARSPTRAR